MKRNSILTLYPTAKLWIVLFYSVSALILGSIKFNGYPLYMMISFLAVPFLAALSGVFKSTFSVLRKLMFLCMLIVILQTFLVKNPTSMFSVNVFNLFNINAYEESFQYALTLSFSILCIGGILAWFFRSTGNRDIICAFEKNGMNPKTAYVFLSTLQMIEVLQKNSKTIMSAQQARGVETEGNIFVRAKAFLPTMIPLIISAINNTEERVLTLESKGFTVNCKKTRIYDVLPNGKEKVAILIFVAIMVLIILWRVLLWV